MCLLSFSMNVLFYMYSFQNKQVIVTHLTQEHFHIKESLTCISFQSKRQLCLRKRSESLFLVNLALTILFHWNKSLKGKETRIWVSRRWPIIHYSTKLILKARRNRKVWTNNLSVWAYQWKVEMNPPADRKEKQHLNGGGGGWENVISISLSSLRESV